ncbi:crossover junction endodeoxyribonuclease RuvC [Candidatus Pandoraea novymonadis]|uniref:Crossover junction endodeoxyribonuclease RuvC n=1 Tax=Candidatus Pandoraea novymonadis TaxID=1808959 RepID=A0ABX5FF32_9BURK|nr:crossover junction endodeoxyribonuclease RuvC [Candidatus Pandoraea novymonadis]PSB92313.1 Crossover junction endodeoxyribonuclease RuvC [Candidatus Pandoraea novymonadis]
MKILGIDPGLRVTGFGILEKHGTRLKYVTSGVIRSGEGTLSERLKVIFTNISELVTLHRPHQAAIEKVFLNVNPKSTLLLGQARGVAMCALAVGGLPIFEYTALQLKKATVGHGQAQKIQVQEMVMRLLMLSDIPSVDAADALGVAICHAHSSDCLTALSGFSLTLAHKGLHMRRGRLIG